MDTNSILVATHSGEGLSCGPCQLDDKGHNPTTGETQYDKPVVVSAVPGPATAHVNGQFLLNDQVAIESLVNLFNFEFQMFGISNPLSNISGTVALDEHTTSVLLEAARELGAPNVSLDGDTLSALKDLATQVSNPVLHVDENLRVLLLEFLDMLKTGFDTKINIKFDIFNSKLFLVLLGGAMVFSIGKYGLVKSSLVLVLVFSAVVFFYHKEDIAHYSTVIFDLFSYRPQAAPTLLPLLVSFIAKGFEIPTLYEKKLMSFSTLVNWCSSLDYTTTTMTKFVQKLYEVIAVSIVFVGDLMGKDFSNLFLSHETEFLMLKQELQDILVLYSDGGKKLDVEITRRFQFVEHKLLKMLSTVVPSPMNSCLRYALESTLRDIRELSLRIKSAGLSGRKPQPYLVHIYGESGVGKTTIMGELATILTNLILTKEQREDFMLNRNKYFYVKDSGQFWGGYTPDCVTMFYPDLFAATDKPGNPESEANVLIQALGTNMFKLPMAEISEKKDTFFVSNIILSASNVRYIDQNVVPSVNYPDAVTRRLNSNAWSLTLKEGWSIDGKLDIRRYYREMCETGDIPDFAIFERIDVRKNMNDVNRPPVTSDTDPYRIGTKLTTRQFIRYNIVKLREHIRIAGDETGALEAFSNRIRMTLDRPESWYDDVELPGDTNPDRLLVVNPQSGPDVYTLVDSLVVYPVNDDIYGSLFKFNSWTEFFDHVMVEHPLRESFKDKLMKLSYSYVREYVDHCSDEIKVEPALLIIALLGLEPKTVEQQYGDSYFTNGITSIVAQFDYWFDLFKNKSSLLYQYLSSQSVSCFGKFFDWYNYFASSKITKTVVGVVSVLGLVGVLIKLWTYMHGDEPVEIRVQTLPMVTSVDKGKMDSLSQQMCNISFKLYTDTKSFEVFAINGLFICSNYCLIPLHFKLKLESLREHDCIKRIMVGVRMYGKNGGDYDWFEFNNHYGVVSVEAPHLEKRDVGILHFPRMPQRSDIRKYFPSVGWDKFLEGFDGSVGHILNLYVRSHTRDAITVVRQVGTNGSKLVCNNGIDVLCPDCGLTWKCVTTLSAVSPAISYATIDGQCGMIGITCDAYKNTFQQVYPGINNPVIMYFHIGGAYGTGFGARIFKEDLDFLSNSIKTKNPFEHLVEIKSQLASSYFETTGDTTVVVDELDTIVPYIGHVDNMDSNHSVVGVYEGASPASRSRIEKSVLHRYVPTEWAGYRRPARLIPSLKETTWFYPMGTGLQPYGTHVTKGTIYEQCVLIEFLAKYRFNYANERIPFAKPLRRALTYEEVVCGIPDLITSIDRTSSAGPSFKEYKALFKARASSVEDVRGMKWIWGAGVFHDLERPAAKFIQSVFEKCDALIRQGSVVATLYAASLKDECVSLEKQQKKTVRIFFSGNIHITMLNKKYFGMFLAWRKKSRGVRPHQVGINPFNDFTHLLNSLKNINPDGGYFSDFSKFDKRMPFHFLDSFFEEAKLFYGNDDVEGNQARAVLREMAYMCYVKANTDIPFDESVFSGCCVDTLPRSLTHCYLFEMQNITISGHYCTADMNSSASDACIMLALFSSYCREVFSLSYTQLLRHDPLVAIKLFSKILEENVVFTYGDDSVLASPYTWLSFSHLEKAAFDFGFVLTDECDDKPKVGEVTPYEYGMFLSRAFKINSENSMKVDAPLKFESLWNIIRYHEKGLPASELLMMCQQLLFELASHGRSIFNKEIEIVPGMCPDKDFAFKGTYASFVEKIVMDVLHQPVGVTNYDLCYATCNNLEYKFGEPLMEICYRLGEDTRLRRVRRPIPRELDTHLEDALLDVAGFTPGECADSGRLTVTDDQQVTLYAEPDGITPASHMAIDADMNINLQSSNELNNVEKHLISENVDSIDCTEAGTTCFVESKNVIESSHPSERMVSTIMIRDDTLVDFLKKPVLLSSFDWIISSGIGTNLFSYDIKNILSQAPYADKLKGFGLFRGTFHLRVELNASPFQQGLLWISYLPNYSDRIVADPGFAGKYTGRMHAIVQHPGAYLSARDKCLDFEIPYIAPTPFYDLRAGTYDWGRVYIDVALALATGVSGQGTAEVTVFGYFTDVEFAAPIVPQMSRAKYKKNEEAEKNKPISTGLMLAATVAEKISDIPLLSLYAKPASWFLRGASGLASAFGFSKPRNDSPPAIMYPNPGRYLANVDGPDLSVPLGLVSDPSVTVMTSHSITGVDEMSLSFLRGVQHYYTAASWLTSYAADTKLIDVKLSPSVLQTTITSAVGPYTQKYAQGGPIWYLSNFFKQWRGSMKMRIRFAKTAFHTGKLLVAYNPGEVQGATINNSATAFVLRNIVDLSDQDEFEIEFPYMCNRYWLDTGVGSAAPSMGRVVVSVLNQLKCPETVSQSCDFQVTFTFGDDFELACPCASTPVSDSTTIAPTPVVISPQSGARVVYAKPVADSDSPVAGLDVSAMTIGDKFMSVKQLLLKQSPLPNTIISQSVVDKTYNILPYTLGGARVVSGTGPLYHDAVGDTMSLLLPMYAFHRGTVRVCVHAVNTSTTNPGLCQAEVSVFASKNFGSLTKNVVQLPNVSIGVSKLTTSFSTWAAAAPSYTELLSIVPFAGSTPVTQNEPINVRIPPYAQFSTYFLPVRDPTNSGLAEPTDPNAVLQVTFSSVSPSAGTPDIKCKISRAVCDDWMSTFFIGAPPLLVNFS